MAKKPKTTTRSYTLGLLAPGDSPNWTPLWDRLFRTHYSICRGAREFGEFYLNLRGGLPASLAEPDAGASEAHRRLLQRGSRRMLALGWLSVEDDHGAKDHPDRVLEVGPGQSLPAELAEVLLREILAEKGISSNEEQSEWVVDCLPALTATIRSDAVWVNRARAFATWKREAGDDGDDMPAQARRILFNMCGTAFVSLTLPDEDATRTEDEQEDQDLVSEADDADDARAGPTSADGVEDVEPSNASRRVFGDLFGGDAAEKVARARGKDEFAAALREFLEGTGIPSRDAILAFREKCGLPQLDVSEPDKYPAEVTSSGAPTAVAKRYRKLLVRLGLWPQSDAESGTPRTEAKRKFAKRLSATDGEDHGARINAWDLLDACPKAPAIDSNPATDDLAGARVRSPAWAIPLARQVAIVTQMPADARSMNEFKRLMFALAARRVSQTQSWTKRNELERHNATLREDRALAKLREIDPDGCAREWLKAYEDRRGDLSGAVSSFRVTKRMIGECEAVLKAWRGTASPDERDAKTASVQASAEKFGDPALYADLACDLSAEAIWRSDRGADILREWVRLRQSQCDQQRLKIPRFCHPDPFRHPTWCEFGGTSKPKVWYACNLTSKPSHPEPGGDADGVRRLWMLLPNYDCNEARPVPVRWQCKRLAEDLGVVRGPLGKPIPRSDRLSLAAARLPRKDVNKEPIRYRPEFPFSKDAKGWNARLQADREALSQLEEQWDAERGLWRDGGKALRAVRWFVTFAPALAVSDGPGRAIHPKLGWKSSPHTDLNNKQKREGHAKVILSRLPGLRVLSVDLGHRYAAACAVWKTLSREQMEAACRAASCPPPTRDRLFLLLKRHTEKLQKSGRRKGQAVEESALYRRIGDDTLPDGSPHPAPWARLERQFLIKLQGEEQAARAASEGAGGEIDRVGKFAARLGLASDDDPETGRAVDELMARAVRVATLGLKRHARRAKITNALDPKTKAIPGMGGSEKEFEIGDEAHIRFLTDALFDWHALASESKWDDKAARELWNAHVAELPHAGKIAPPIAAEGDDDRTRQQRHKADDELREQLKTVAVELAVANRAAMHEAWKERWEKDDGHHAEVPPLVRDANGRGPSRTVVEIGATGWHAELRWLTDWIMGWRLTREAGRGSTQNVGGVSVTRITTMKSLYQLHKAFAMRAKPDKPRGAPEKGESNAGIAQSILDAMERMREQRVKQLASRIAASALGLGGHRKEVELPKRDKDGAPLRKPDGSPQTKKRWVWVEEPEPKYAPCHAVVIENLTNYRPEETRTRRENRQLMSWSSSKVKKYLSEACQLHGLHLREVQAGYTSRQDSRTGAPGVRCRDFPVTDFVTQSGFLWKHVKRSLDKVQDGSTDHEHLYIRDLLSNWNREQRTWTDAAANLWVLGKDGRWLGRDGQPQDKRKYKSPAPVRLPWKGGELFVSAEPGRHEAVAFQADLNAAANIGLKALLDPDWPGKWWYVPAAINDQGWRVPSPKSCAGATWVEHWKVAQDSDGCYSPTGSPLELTDDEGVKLAQEAAKQAKSALDAADKALKAAKRTKKASEIEAATARRQDAKTANEAAKKALAAAKKGATPKEVINLWRDPVSVAAADFASGRAWRVYDAYKPDVEKRVIQLLREQAGLPRE